MSYVTNKTGSSHWAQTISNSLLFEFVPGFQGTPNYSRNVLLSLCGHQCISKRDGALAWGCLNLTNTVIFIPIVSWASILTWAASTFTPEPSCWFPVLWILTQTKHNCQAFAIKELTQHKSATSFSSSRASAVGWKPSVALTQCVSRAFDNIVGIFNILKLRWFSLSPLDMNEN